ncbi:hypothetical protein [Pseudonocardia charpentierae]|uniref:Excreted virulence factor EspC, type VII ESX diderm n=1 Tax=Pseudonocardia charpentierae TaxID=3075545 RepID=A0ABU2NAB6_9PSEU|nr:hypothetical protein [Pseudonocardia sp. DSM 45834]MDT0349988.1 hypothetical protein [Pseudonocardia sp. DSM 45834]
MDNAMNALWRAQQDAATRAAEGWLGLLQPGTDQAPQTPAAPATADDQDQAPPDSDTSDEVAAPDDTSPEVGVEPAPLEVIEAIRNLGNGQREFAEHMTRWAELQRDLADTMTAWASRQGEYADALERLLGPSKPHL